LVHAEKTSEIKINLKHISETLLPDARIWKKITGSRNCGDFQQKNKIMAEMVCKRRK
jgi:hypothetical protein